MGGGCDVARFDSALHAMKGIDVACPQRGVLGVRRSDSSPDQTCSNRPLSGFGSSAASQYGNREPGFALLMLQNTLLLSLCHDKCNTLINPLM